MPDAKIKQAERWKIYDRIEMTVLGVKGKEGMRRDKKHKCGFGEAPSATWDICRDNISISFVGRFSSKLSQGLGCRWHTN